ncbi:MAG TPA: hypothetical protein VIL42_09130 [Sphingomicrobium sp.]|jgi:hypothetical protein
MVTIRRLPSLAPAAVLPIALLGLTASCGGPEPANVDAVANEESPAPEFTKKASISEGLMDRAALLAAVAQAASASTLQQDDSAAQRALEGKQFEVRIRFGCSGPAQDLDRAELGWTYDGENRVLRVRAMPTLGSDDTLVETIAAEPIEAVEGFWLPRPWVLQAACPVPAQRQGANGESVPAQSEADRPAVTTSPRIGIAQFFTADESRTARRGGRPYQATQTLAAGATDVGQQGFDLILSGRLRAVPGGRVIRCVGSGGNRPPDCIIGAQFDRVRIEEPRTRELIAQWAKS